MFIELVRRNKTQKKEIRHKTESEERKDNNRNGTEKLETKELR
jgi:hypothetical protein